MVIWHLKQIGKVKKLRKWMPHELTHTHTQIIVLKCCLLLFFSTTMNHFSIGLLHATKSGFYLITGDNQLRGWIEGKLWTCTKKRSWSLFGGLLPVLSTIAFWILAKPLHLRSMLSKSMRCTENCNACSQYWSTRMAQFFSTTTPNLKSHNQHFKS